MASCGMLSTISGMILWSCWSLSEVQFLGKRLHFETSTKFLCLYWRFHHFPDKCCLLKATQPKSLLHIPLKLSQMYLIFSVSELPDKSVPTSVLYFLLSISLPLHTMSYSRPPLYWSSSSGLPDFRRSSSIFKFMYGYITVIKREFFFYCA